MADATTVAPDVGVRIRSHAHALPWAEPTGWTDRAIMHVVRRLRSTFGATADPANPRALVGLVRILILVVLLNMVDAALTIWQASVRPDFADLNPLVQALIAAGHPGGIALLKVAVLTFAAVVLLLHYTRPSAQWAGRIALAITLWVCLHWVVYLADYIPRHML